MILISQVEIRLINIGHAKELLKRILLARVKLLDLLITFDFFRFKKKLTSLIKPVFITQKSNEKNQQKVCRFIA